MLTRLVVGRVDPNEGQFCRTVSALMLCRCGLELGAFDEPVVCGSCGDKTLETSATHVLKPPRFSGCGLDKQ